ncbi:MAG: response regulator [Chloroflexi bacterium]|nr:MAG: response regulator [Chloroflexota bacterium]
MAPSKVLVVEDNADNLALVRFLLERAGFQVFTAGNGLDGLRLARENLPNLILLDLAIPALDGWATARALKADESTRGIPIVALTAYTMPADQQRAMEAGCEGFIPKPINVVAFIKEVSSYLEEKQQH